MIPAVVGLLVYKPGNVAYGNDDDLLFDREHLQDAVKGWEEKPDKDWTLFDVVGKHGMEVTRT